MTTLERRPEDLAMDRYATGDDQAFAVVYDVLSERLYRYLRRRTTCEAHAEDLVQQTFLVMHRARGTFIAGSAVLPWAYAIARRLLIDDARRNRRSVRRDSSEFAEASLPSPAAGADEELVARETAMVVARVLAGLPENQRMAFELLRVQGLSHSHAAEVLGTTVSAVKLRAHRAYTALRKRYVEI